MTEKEAKDFVANKSPFHKGYFASEEEYAEFQSNVSLEQFQKRYGKRKGLNKFHKYQKRRQYINSLQYYIDKYGEIDGMKNGKNIINLKLFLDKK